LRLTVSIEHCDGGSHGVVNGGSVAMVVVEATEDSEVVAVGHDMMGPPIGNDFTREKDGLSREKCMFWSTVQENGYMT
jgi:hypothetical protein